MTSLIKIKSFWELNLDNRTWQSGLNPIPSLSDFKALNFDLLFSAFPGNQFYDGYLHEDAIGNVLQGMVLRWHCFMAAMGGGVSGSMRVSNWRPIRQRSRGINLVLVTRWESSGPYMTFVKMEHASLNPGSAPLWFIHTGRDRDQFCAVCFTLHRDQDLSQDLKIIFYVFVLEKANDTQCKCKYYA